MMGKAGCLHYSQRKYKPVSVRTGLVEYGIRRAYWRRKSYEDELKSIRRRKRSMNSCSVLFGDCSNENSISYDRFIRLNSACVKIDSGCDKFCARTWLVGDWTNCTTLRRLKLHMCQRRAYFAQVEWKAKLFQSFQGEVLLGWSWKWSKALETDGSGKIGKLLKVVVYRKI